MSIFSEKVLEKALQYAGRKWHMIPLKPRGKAPAIKTGDDHLDAATTDESQLRQWFGPRSTYNLGIVTGAISNLLVIDLDSSDAIAWWAMKNAPRTYTVRTAKGFHLYYQHPGVYVGISAGGEREKGVDIRCDGGIVVAPPSIHESGHEYTVVDDRPTAPFPAELVEWAQNRGGGADKPSRRKKKEELTGAAGNLTAALGSEKTASFEDVCDALRVMPNPTLGWEDFKTIIMAIYMASGGSEWGRLASHKWGQKNKEKYNAEGHEKAWREASRSPPDSLGYGKLWWRAKQADPTWEPPSRRPKNSVPPGMEPPKSENVSGVSKANGNHAPQSIFGELPSGNADNPLILLNEQFATIGDLGGKCLVLSWVPSKIDPSVKVPSFQTFKAFTERYSHEYVAVKTKNDKGEVKTQHKPKGSYWLQWTGRRHYEGMDLLPGQPPELPGKVLNLWRGFGVTPAPGSWGLMKAHITNVLAAGDAQAAVYIFKYAAWCVQNPDKRAEVALVFRGDKGSGKGTFANALRRIFGSHGLQIYNSKHLTGQFNGHLRSCLLLFADEAFWAGDKQGESTLKGMITEPTLVVEHKGVDAQAWHNRLKVIMAANADWVVPASHNERRYAVFNVSGDRIGDRAYFNALHKELEDGGLAAMLHDLLAAKLDGWHPREVVTTSALQEQKARSLTPLQMWWENALQTVSLPVDKELKATSAALMENAQKWEDRWTKINPTSLGLFLKTVGAVKGHHKKGNFWTVPEVKIARKIWEQRYGKWAWHDEDAEEWNEKDPKPSTIHHSIHP